MKKNTEPDPDVSFTHHPNPWALLPLGVFFLLYIVAFLFGGLDRLPVSIAFLAASMTAVVISRGGGLTNRIHIFCRGAANDTILLMIVIFILAGAFAGSARAMGAVEATVGMVRHLLPPDVIPASIFVAACFISMSMGTSCGTIAALAPVAAGFSGQGGFDMPLMLGIVIGGAMFGDNLSFISDTTIVATRTQGCRMQDKFRANIRLVLPVAALTLLVYIFAGIYLSTDHAAIPAGPVEWIKILPYLIVLATALAGVNVILVLCMGIVSAGIIGLAAGNFGIWDWVGAMNTGIVSDMGELIIVTLMAGGLFELIRFNGGIDWLIMRLTRGIRSPRRAEAAIAGLVTFTDLCTANNTIALIITGPIARKIGDRFALDGKRTASLLDTFSCAVQGLIPYGAQLLIAVKVTGGTVSPVEILPYACYPALMGLGAIAAIIFRRTKRGDAGVLETV
jgi:Na+/H+ antiporter NhaC